jgi:preprotein translocase subunit YajC
MALCLLLGTRPDAGAPPAASYLFPILAIVFIYYFVLIRPQQKESQRHRKLLDSLKKGDEVVTDSGLVGTVVAVQDDFVVLKAGENVKLKFLKSKIWNRVSSSGDASAKNGAKEAKETSKDSAE